MLISVCKKLIRGQVLCTGCGSLRCSASLIPGRYGDRDIRVFTGHTAQKQSNTQILLFPSHYCHTKTQKWPQQGDPLALLLRGGLRGGRGIPGRRTKQLLLGRIAPRRELEAHVCILSLRKPSFPF